MPGISSIYITFPDQSTAEQISHQLVEEKLAACANIFPIKSTYWWENSVNSEDEWVAILKTTHALWPTVQDRAATLHPYEVPCIIRYQVEANEAYEEWVKSSVQ